MSLPGEVISYLLAAIYLAAAIAKFAGAPKVVRNFETFGLSRRVRWGLGGCEVVGVALLLIPPVTFLGTVGFIALMAGAAFMHLRAGDITGTVPAVLLGLLNLWVLGESLPAFVALVS